MAQPMPVLSRRIPLAALTLALVACGPQDEATAPEIAYTVQDITHGPASHFYGYIGHVGNTPYAGDDRLLVALRAELQDRLPGTDDPADIVLIDSVNGYAVAPIEQTRAWNPQQGTMLYWNPDRDETQFFFNDRDPETGKVFTVLYDIRRRERVREYRFEDHPIGNGGVRQNGGRFAGINYARLARLRPVTGYAGAWDWTEGDPAPDDDGVWVVDIETGEADLIVSYAQMRDALVERHPRAAEVPLFVNHTLWNRDGDRLFFFVRGDFSNRENRVNVPMTVRPDGSELTEQRVFIGGHPEWESGSRMIGAVGDDLVLYDTATQQVVDTIGTPEIFPDPEGDTALSRDGGWIANGWKEDSGMRLALYRRSDGAWVHLGPFDISGYESGDLRIDPAPKWNRAGDRVVFPALAENGTRQLFEVRIQTGE